MAAIEARMPCLRGCHDRGGHRLARVDLFVQATTKGFPGKHSTHTVYAGMAVASDGTSIAPAPAQPGDSTPADLSDPWARSRWNSDRGARLVAIAQAYSGNTAIVPHPSPRASAYQFVTKGAPDGLTILFNSWTLCTGVRDQGVARAMRILSLPRRRDIRPSMDIRLVPAG